MKKNLETDILVLGSGIAGLSAAIYGAKSGASVILASSAQTFSGSTFYPGTWGLGLIGPESEEDIENLIESIITLGKGMALEPLVRTFITNLNPTIDFFETLGITLEKPAVGTEGEKEYIPCFDKKHRRWRGLTKQNLKEALPSILEDLGIVTMPFFEAIKLIKYEDQVVGAVGIKEKSEIFTIKAKATVLATGGLSGLYKRYLTTKDVSGTGLGMALMVGAKGINLEFTQMMLGFISPGAKTVHNEKTFKASRFYNEEDKPFLEKSLPKGITLEEVLMKRSLHGPFSSETNSKYLDLGIYKEILRQEEKSVTLRYDMDKLNSQADFVKTYFSWLKEEKAISPSEDIKIAPFMHASNGGILINEKGETGVSGLYAAGEVSGGMHGADRIGGLSTANGMVFGKIAGESAAQFAKERVGVLEDYWYDFNPIIIKNTKEKIGRLKVLMDENGFLMRREDRLSYLLEELSKLVEERKEEGNIKEVKDSYQLINRVLSAMALASMQKERKESRGSHYREDYPFHNEKLKFPMTIRLKETKQNDFKASIENLVLESGKEEV